MNKKVWLVAGVLTPLLIGTGCLVVPGRHGQPVLLAPPLPPIVVFDTEPYYVQSGYHYHYQNDGWYYSQSRNGPWVSLPRDRYPKEVRYRDGRSGHDKGHNPPGHRGR